jgi:hypothetical protein
VSRRVITFDRGSKRRIQEIRWKPIQIVSAILLVFIAIALCIVLAFWEASHYLVQPRTPQFEPATRMGVLCPACGKDRQRWTRGTPLHDPTGAYGCDWLSRAPEAWGVKPTACLQTWLTARSRR